jgi:hypothetical protein
MSQVKTFVFGASKLTPNPTAGPKITPDAEWTQHHTPNPEYTDSTECSRSFGFYEDNDDDENLEENDNGILMNDPALDALRATVERIKLQVNVDRKAACFQAEALTSIQQSNASGNSGDQCGHPRHVLHQGMPDNPAPGQQPLGAPTQGTHPHGPPAPGYFSFGAPVQGQPPQGALVPHQYQFGAPILGPYPQGPSAPESYPPGPSAPGSHSQGPPTTGSYPQGSPTTDTYPLGPPVPKPFHRDPMHLVRHLRAHESLNLAHLRLGVMTLY